MQSHKGEQSNNTQEYSLVPKHSTRVELKVKRKIFLMGRKWRVWERDCHRSSPSVELSDVLLELNHVIYVVTGSIYVIMRDCARDLVIYID